MANAVLIASLGIALILFAIQEYMDANKRKVASLMIRATFMGTIGIYLIYLYQEMSSGGNMGGGAPMMGV